MEPILVYGFPLGSSMGLVAALEWLGQPYRLCRVDMLGEMKTEAFARLNGRQETPALITADGLVLTETMAIAGHLAARDTQRRISFALGTLEADRMAQFMAYVNTGFTGAFSPLWVAMESDALSADELKVLRRYGLMAVADRHGKLEAMIGDGPYLVGDRPSLADAIFVGVARWAEFHEAVDATAYPKLSALKARLGSDPAVQFAVAIENGEQPEGSGACRGHVGLGEIIARFGRHPLAA
ncbi:glutathione S-transferase family protein [Phreatobacter sp. HK31-P]